MRVLVTGAAGLYGVHTVAELVSSAKTGKIFALDDMSRGFLGREPFILPEGFAEKVQIMKRDFRTLKAKEIDAMKLDTIMHFAAHVSIDESMVNPRKYFDNNELGTFNLCRELLASKTKPALIYASSPEVYGNPLRTPMDELHPLSPRSVYAVTKLAAEKHCLSMFEWHNYPVNVIRNFNTFGENQNLWGYSAVIPAFISRALKGQALQVSGSGEQTRDFLYVKDAARAYRMLAEKGGSIKGEIFNIGTGKQTSVKALAEKIIKITGSGSEIVSAEARKGDLKALEADVSKISSSLGWKPKYTLEQGLKETAEWYGKFVK
ncbi:MAG: GDP-mannose 4,6-dehydratase [Candidatus Diapherotrites archaeon]